METPPLDQFLLSLGQNSAEAGALVLLILATQWFFRKRLTPYWCCLMWSLVAVRLLLPFSCSSAVSMFNFLPQPASFHAPPPAQRESPPAVAGDKSEMVDNFQLTGAPEPAVSGAATPLPTLPEGSSANAWGTLIFGVWMAGVLVLGGQVLLSSLQLRRGCSKLPPLPRAAAVAALRECAGKLQLRKSPILLESFKVSSPALHGLFQPRLLLPPGFTSKFSATELRFVFLHELAHLKRRDLLVNWLMVVLQVLHWFNPLIWFGFTRWRAERELACDAMALEAAGEGHNKEYGQTILRLLENLARPRSAPGLVGILENKHQLQRRISMIASFVPTRGWPQLAVLLIAFLIVIGLTDAESHTASVSSPASNSPAAAGDLTAEKIPLPPQTGTAASVFNIQSANATDNDLNAVSLSNEISGIASAGTLTLNEPATAATSLVLNDSLTLNEPATVSTGLVLNNSLTLNQPADVSTHDMVADSLTLNSQTSTPANARSLAGAWVLVGAPGHIHKAPSSGGRIKVYVGSHWYVNQADAKSGVVVFHHGGTYSLEGDNYHESVNFAGSSTVNFIGQTNGNFTIQWDENQMTLIGVGNPWKEVWQRVNPVAARKSTRANELAGIWTFVANIGETNSAPNPNRIKFISENTWSDTEIDPKTGVVMYHHGGTCSLKGDHYVESCKYANPTTMNFIDHDFKFTAKVEGDSLTLRGISNPWNEIWKRAD